MKQNGHNDISTGIREISRDLRKYVEKRLELFSLTISEQLSFILADSIQQIAGLLLFAGGFYFLWMALGFYLGELLESYSLGFLLAALPLMFGGVLFLKIQPAGLTKKIQSDILTKMMESADQITNELTDHKENKKGEEVEKTG